MKDFKIIFNLVRPYWKRVALAGVISLLISGLNASLAWLVKPAMDEVLIRKEATLLLLLPIGVLSIFAAKGILNFFHEYLMRSAANKMVMNLRNRLYEHILNLHLPYFGKNSSGSLISRVINDTGSLQSLLSLTIKDLFVEGASVIALTAVALWRRWDIALIALVVLPMAFYTVGRLGKRLREISKRSQEKISMLTETLHEGFSGIRVIKAFCREGDEALRFSRKNKDFYREMMRSVRVSELSALIMEITSGVGIAFVIWYGSRLVVNNIITIGDFFSFLTAIFMLYTPAKRLTRVNVGIQQARAALHRTMEIFNEKPEKDGTLDLRSFNNEIRLEGVSFIYPSSTHKALDNINLSVKKGEIVAIVGKSGGGKTTLINMLPRFYTPSEGRILIDGINIAAFSAKSLRSLFGLVSQDVFLFNDTIAANLAYGKPDATMEGIIEAAMAAYAHSFIMELPKGYDTVIGERGMRLSGGQRQRLSIARAILKDPAILILDEATSSLDSDSERMIQNALEQLMQNRTTIVIAHRLSTIKKAHRIIVLDKGRIVESGTHSELLRHKGIYSKLYEIQFSRQE